MRRIWGGLSAAAKLATVLAAIAGLVFGVCRGIVAAADTRWPPRSEVAPIEARARAVEARLDVHETAQAEQAKAQAAKLETLQADVAAVNRKSDAILFHLARMRGESAAYTAPRQ